MKGLYEILTEKAWMVNPEFVHGIRKIFEQNLNNHIAFTKPQKKMGFVRIEDERGIYYPEEYQISEDGQQVRSHWSLTENSQKFPFVSVLTLDGPITRNGGGCSYGSKDHRDMMIEAADHPLCCGHIFLIDTPGGSAWAKNDYEQAIDYAHSLGQPVLAFIDGLCASAGMYLASLCDERYYMHPKNEVGCIGVMAAFYTEANGSLNQYTNETYHELYDPESFDKNKEIRDIANDGDTDELVKQLADLGVSFRSDVKKACPNAEEEHLHGKIFNAEDVDGILVDGQSDFKSVVQRAFKLFRGEESYIVRNNPNDKEKSQTDDTIGQENFKNIDMANYPLINEVCGMKEGDIVVNEEGAFMNVLLLDAIEKHLASANEAISSVDEEQDKNQKIVSEMQEKLEEMSSQLDKSTEAKNDVETKFANLQKETDKLLKEKDEKISSLENEKNELEKSLSAVKQELEDKDAQIEELGRDAGTDVNAGEAPSNNGEGVKIQGMSEFNPDCYKSNAERKKAFERFKKGE